MTLLHTTITIELELDIEGTLVKAEPESGYPIDDVDDIIITAVRRNGVKIPFTASALYILQTHLTESLLSEELLGTRP